MKRLKLYEQFEIGDLSEEEIFGKPDPNKGPYDDILEYGKDGPDFKAGDRVINIANFGSIGPRMNAIGTVVDYFRILLEYCFDEPFENGHRCDTVDNIPTYHGWFCSKNYLKKINI